jgi:hypothetical protein
MNCDECVTISNAFCVANDDVSAFTARMNSRKRRRRRRRRNRKKGGRKEKNYDFGEKNISGTIEQVLSKSLLSNKIRCVSSYEEASLCGRKS